MPRSVHNSPHVDTHVPCFFRTMQRIEVVFAVALAEKDCVILCDVVVRLSPAHQTSSIYYIGSSAGNSF